MLAVQQYLETYGLDKLVEEYKINIKYHPNLPLMILNYDQLDSSPKWHPVVKNCRGLILEKETFKLVSRSFDRFFNYGECQQFQEDFNWKDFIVQEKVDGSLISLFNYNNTWMVATRGSFADGKMEPWDFTWEELICRCLGVSKICNVKLNPRYNYICELVSAYNKVVRDYSEPGLYLLTMFERETELPYKEVQFMDCRYFVNPEVYKFSSASDILEFLKHHPDKTFEGVVIRDNNNNRIKIKTDTYVALHHLKGNGNLFLTKNLLPFILRGEASEVSCHFKEAKDKIEYIENIINNWKLEITALWDANKNLESQKNFALAVKDHPLKSILFAARKLQKDPLELLTDFSDLLLKNL
jgi:hypothetical protein